WNVSGTPVVAEGATGIYTVSYTGVTLAPGATATVVVASTTILRDWPNATPNVDYTALNPTTLTFTGGGPTQQTVAVSTIQDTVFESTEDYAVVIGNQSQGVLGTSEAVTLISDNDAAALRWSVNGATQVTEGGVAVYTVSYTGAAIGPGQTATITIASSNLVGGADNATPSPNLSADYGAMNTVLTFTGGSPTIRTVQVTTVNDTIVENTEDYRVTISGPSVGSTVLGQSQVGTNIVD